MEIKQTDRIKNKLDLVRKADPLFSAFGADSHRYFLDKPASQSEVAAFEARYEIRLPAAFRAFLTEIGNGGIEEPNSVTGNSAAGPSYGIYKLGEPYGTMFDSEDSDSGYLKEPVFFTPEMTQDVWTEMQKFMDDGISDDDYDRYEQKVYAGILVIGFCGCSNFQGILLNGPYTGRVVYLYDEIQYAPHLAPEPNFLDWYENWLDGIIDKPNEPVAKKWWQFW